MANWDHVFPYTRELADWLAREGYPHPEVRSGNRLPTTGELFETLRKITHGSDPLVPEGDRLYVSIEKHPEWTLCISGFDFGEDSSTPESSFKLCGELGPEVAFLILLAGTCGQLLAYRDSGDVPLLLDADQDPARICATYRAAQANADAWMCFFSGLYGTQP